jgi:hypothetical protein
MNINTFFFLLELCHITTAVDIYSLGMVTLEVRIIQYLLFLIKYLDDKS